MGGCEEATRVTMSRVASSHKMTTRRDFVRTASGAVVAMAGAPSLILRSRAGADIIVRNGTVFDGLGTAGKELDVVIAAGVSHPSLVASRIAARSRSTRAAWPSRPASSTSTRMATELSGPIRVPSR